MFKCFVQINRDLLYAIAKEAGMPPRVLDTYFKFINNLNVRFQVGQRIGAGHKDRCSIPQGCPFSMTMIALIMVPWVKLMREGGVEPRVLADDLMFSSAGSRCRGLTLKAMNLSRQFFTDLGAKVAVKKCFTFASDSSTRQFLTDYEWDVNGLKIPCVSNFRDLGTHLNLTKGFNGATLTDRMVKGIDMAKRLKWLPMSRPAKENIVRSNILPAALYGAEAAHVNASVLQRLRAAIASAIGPASRKRSVNLTFCFTNSSKDLDPVAHILYNRVAGLRRLMAKHGAGKLALVKLIVKRINSGCTPAAQAEKRSTPFGSWKRDLYSQWKEEREAGKGPLEEDDPKFQGPVSYLMSDLKACGCQLTNDLNIVSSDGVCCNMWDAPWQHLKAAVFDLAIKARDTQTGDQRTFLGDVSEIDHEVVKAVFHQFGVKDKRVYAHVATGGFWGEDQLVNIRDTNGACPHCGAPNADTTHINWECPVINKHRTFNDLKGINIRCFPKAISNGIPPAMVIGCDGAFWDGSKSDQFGEDLCSRLFAPDPNPSHQPDNVRGLVEHAMIEGALGDYSPRLSAHQVCAKLKAGIGGRGENVRPFNPAWKRNLSACADSELKSGFASELMCNIHRLREALTYEKHCGPQSC